jgi:hypothetical protein
VVAAVNFAREQNLVVAVKGGAHNLPATSVCDDGPVIDFLRYEGHQSRPVEPHGTS